MKTLHPEFIKMITALGEPLGAGLLHELSCGTPSVAIRLNRAKGAAAVALTDATEVPWSGGRGFYLPRRPVFALDPAWHQGLYYVQDASSMALGAVVAELVERFFQDNTQIRYLDACAAPGGKTLAAVDALPSDAFVLANEYDFRRASILTENVVKHGSSNVAVSRGDTARLAALGPVFDIVAADVPCSGEGMMRKDDEAVAQWTPALVDSCVARQREILANLWQTLRPGGFLIYSTCTFNRAENEENVAWLVDNYGAESVPVALSDYPGVAGGIDTPYACCRFIPGRIDGEGLFLAVLRKDAADISPSCRRRDKGRKGVKPVALPSGGAEYVLRCLGDGFKAMLMPDGATLTAVPTAAADFASTLRDGGLDILACGIAVAALRGRELAPCHALAMAASLRAGSFPVLDLDYRSAMAYLHGDALSDIPDGAPRGYLLPCYRGKALGLAKCVGRRANNLYPDQWRLRSAFPADAPADVVTTHCL
ncbi:MAG: hypothetical protein K1V78_01995 [Muribaculaceae bacterium]